MTCKVRNCTNPIAGTGAEKCEKHLKSPLATRTASRPYVDYDYWNRLNASEKAWLTAFTRDYYAGATAKLLKIHPKKYARSISADNDSRRRCVPLQISQQLTPLTTPSSQSPEDAYIELLDSQAKPKVRRKPRLTLAKPPNSPF